MYSYRHGFSGFAAKLTVKQAQDLAGNIVISYLISSDHNIKYITKKKDISFCVGVSELPGVVKVIPNSIHKLQTTRSWDSLGLSSQSHSNLLHKSARGDNVIVAVFDTGLIFG